jgi:hypothetical protein
MRTFRWPLFGKLRMSAFARPLEVPSSRLGPRDSHRSRSRIMDVHQEPIGLSDLLAGHAASRLFDTDSR